MNMETVMYCIALALVAAITLLGILHPAFDDNLLQRLGLALMCFGAVTRLVTYLQTYGGEGTRFILTYGLAVYCVGTLWKQYRRNTSKAGAA